MRHECAQYSTIQYCALHALSESCVACAKILGRTDFTRSIYCGILHRKIVCIYCVWYAHLCSKQLRSHKLRPEIKRIKLFCLLSSTRRIKQIGSGARIKIYIRRYIVERERDIYISSYGKIQSYSRSTSGCVLFSFCCLFLSRRVGTGMTPPRLASSLSRQC